VRETNERHEVVLAERREGNVANHHHLVVTSFEDHSKVFAGVGLNPFEQLDVHVGHPPRRLQKPRSGGVFPYGFEKLAHETLHARLIDHV
jgi:hypothetical protein